MARLPRLVIPDVAMRRYSTWKQSGGVFLKGWLLVDDRFKAQIEKHTSRRLEPSSSGGDRKSKDYLESPEN